MLNKMVGRSVPQTKINMPQKHQDIWVKIRAELIEYAHKSRNPKLFKNNYDRTHAESIARKQLQYDLSKGELRITLDELLGLSKDQCISILAKYNQGIMDKIRKYQETMK